MTIPMSGVPPDLKASRWRPPIGWSDLIAGALSASGPSGRCFLAQAGDSPKSCAA